MNYYKMAGFGETMDILKKTLTRAEFEGFCKGNILKYRLRAGKKSKDCNEDIKKALHYEEILSEFLEREK